MRAVRDRLTLHQETVEKAEAIARDLKMARRQKAPEQPALRRRYTKRPEWCDIRVWETALRLANGNHRRLEVISSTEIRVTNE